MVACQRATIQRRSREHGVRTLLATDWPVLVYLNFDMVPRCAPLLRDLLKLMIGIKWAAGCPGPAVAGN